MPTFVILLRAVNVGGTGNLPMSDLRAMAETAGLRSVRTYIASGNVVAESGESEHAIKAALERRLADYAGKPVGVLVRSAEEISDVLANNPFPKAAPNHTVAIFLDTPPPSDVLDTVTGREDEKIGLGKREIYVHYGSGMGRSRLKIPSAAKGTARNMNTIARLAAMAGEA